MKIPPGSSRWTSRFHCCRYPYFCTVYPVAAYVPWLTAYWETFGWGLRPGTGTNVSVSCPNGPWFAQVRTSVPVSVQVLALSVADGVNPLSLLAKKLLVELLTGSMYGLVPNET